MKKFDTYVSRDIPISKIERIKILKFHFRQLYGRFPEFYVRTPGRVNIIGEHIDYNGYSVLPMAIDNDILIAVRLFPDHSITLKNMDPRFSPSEYIFSESDTSKQIFINSEKPQWNDYFLAGLKGTLEKFYPNHSIIGIKILISSNLPPCAGLSSSSALVCASTLITCFAHHINLNRFEMAELSCSNERYIGTVGGCMDQAICFLAQTDHASHIKFNPLVIEPVNLPSDYAFVIAHSMIEMDKGNTIKFNHRVLECCLASQILCKTILNDTKWKTIINILQAQKLLNYSLEQMIEAIDQILKSPYQYTLNEILDILQIDLTQFNELSLRGRRLPGVENLTFNLHDRAMHVCKETMRVHAFQRQCQSLTEKNSDCSKNCDKGDISNTEANYLGQLMNESHESCDLLYDCSHPQLNNLVQICRNHGALGSRLTGAGWGGCCVSMVPKSKLDTFLTNVKKDFYNGIKTTNNSAKTPILFPTGPGTGACIYLASDITY